MAVYGLDIGGTKIETAIFDNELNLIKSWRISTPTTDYQVFLETLCDLIHQADEFSQTQGHIGIGMPGLINNNGQVLSANVPCASDKFIAQDLEKLLNRPISIKNDTRCFALSEANGAAKHYSRVFGAIIGTGAAGGLCIDGKLEKASLAMAGEYGHIPLPAHLQIKYNLPIIQCGCGLTGCIESYIAGPRIKRLYNHFTHKTLDAKQWSCDLANNDETALKVLACYLDLLGNTFASLVKLIEPDAIVIGGGISLIDAVIENLPEAINSHLFKGFHSPVILRAKYGDSSGVRGAAILGLQASLE